MRLQELVEVSRGVGATRSRTRKVELLAGALARLEGHERAAGVAFLGGEPRQERLELGPAAVVGVEVPASSGACLEVPEVDAALQAIADVEPGTGSRSRRRQLLADLLGRASPDERDWLRSLVLRELRQGALEGLLVQPARRGAPQKAASGRWAAAGSRISNSDRGGSSNTQAMRFDGIEERRRS